jgi:hypothetical protein
MPSPFPGMDPYLEAEEIWSDFHSTLLPILRKALREHLPAPYHARLDRYVWIDDETDERPQLLGEPDVYVADPVGLERAGAAMAVLAAPVTVTIPAAPPKGKLYIKIVDRRGHRVVTVIEVLSPSNKASGPDRRAYLAKRQEYHAAGTNLVELDLLRAGRRPPAEPPLPRADYYLTVIPVASHPRAGVWPLTVRDRLPTLPIPLNPPDEPVLVDLQLCVNQAYDDADYGQEIDYTQPPVPPLNESDAAWARELIARHPC